MDGRNPNGTFAKNNNFGCNPEGESHFIRKKFLKKWDEVFSADPIGTLNKIKDKDPAEFVRLGISAMPREQKIEGNMNINTPETISASIDRVKELLEEENG